ncbi:hypothetical protein D6789_03795 [Candidatus Woesearchaeota archaeon]|nr:MAG: hypothetical protein D6789_03795 [Candidatus Woesearchaeota archaeon]
MISVVCCSGIAHINLMVVYKFSQKWKLVFLLERLKNLAAARGRVESGKNEKRDTVEGTQLSQPGTEEFWELVGTHRSLQILLGAAIIALVFTLLNVRFGWITNQFFNAGAILITLFLASILIRTFNELGMRRIDRNLFVRTISKVTIRTGCIIAIILLAFFTAAFALPPKIFLTGAITLLFLTILGEKFLGGEVSQRVLVVFGLLLIVMLATVFLAMYEEGPSQRDLSIKEEAIRKLDPQLCDSLEQRETRTSCYNEITRKIGLISSQSQSGDPRG